MITNEMLQIVAEYDGWVKKTALKSGSFYYQKEGRIKICNNEDLPYLTSMDWLHPVAMKAVDDLDVMINSDVCDDFRLIISSKTYYINTACKFKPINGQYIDLFKAVYEAILFINQNKETCETN